MGDTVRLGRWRRVSRFTDNKVAEGSLIFGALQISVTLHHKNGLFWLTFPNRVQWKDNNSLHRLTKAVVTALKTTQSGVFWTAIDAGAGMRHSAIDRGSLLPPGEAGPGDRP